MKKLLLLMLLVIAQSSSFGQIKATVILPDSLVGKGYMQNYVKQALKDALVGPVTPILDSCKAGPIITGISGVTTRSLTVGFHGEKVIKFGWSIKDLQGRQLFSGEISPENNRPSITYDALSAGSYILSITGSSCASKVSSQTFVVPGSTGSIDIPENPSDGLPATIAKGMDEHLNLRWDKQGNQYLVSDLADAAIGSNYEFRYLIGGEIVKTGKAPLKNYPIDGVMPGRIAKYKIKPGLVLNNWTSKPEEVSYYYSLDAAEVFSHNTSVAFSTFSFPGVAGDFVNPIPAAYKPSLQNTQWADFASEMTLPKGHVFIADPRPWGIERALKLGVTHVSNFALPWDQGAPYTEVSRLKDAGLSYNDVPRIETIFGIQKSGNSGELWPNHTSKDWWPNGAPSEQEGYQFGQKTDVSHAIFIGEFSENVSWQPPSEPVFKGFYAGLRPRYEERFGKRGIPYYICHDYMFLGGEKLSSGRDQAKRILELSPEQMPVSNYSPGGTLSQTNLICETVYLNAPDLHTAQPYEVVFRLEYFKQMGYHAGVFLAGVHEWNPNNRYQVDYPEGKFFLSNKMPLDPNLHIANGFLAQVYGSLFVEWGGNGKVENKTIPEDWASGLWYPNGAKDAQGGFPYFKKYTDKDSYYGYSGSVDLSYFSQKLFHDTYGKVEGGKDLYLSFRVDGGDWITPTKRDYIDAYYDKRAFVHSRTLDGKTAFFYLNCFTDNASHKLEVRLPNGSSWSGMVAGNGIHAKLL